MSGIPHLSPWDILGEIWRRSFKYLLKIWTDIFQLVWNIYHFLITLLLGYVFPSCPFLLAGKAAHSVETVQLPRYNLSIVQSLDGDNYNGSLNDIKWVDYNRQDRNMESVFPDTNWILPSRAEDFRKYLWSLTSWRDVILGNDRANFLPIYPVLGFSPDSHCR